MKPSLKLSLGQLPPLCLAIALAALCVSCASPRQSPQVSIVTVNPPNSNGSDFDTHGYLVVNTPSELRYDEQSIRRFPHTGYTIYDDCTHQGQYIRNRLGRAGETPATVVLPAGIYVIEARTVYHRPIRFNVIIRPDTETTVTLDNDLPPESTTGGEYYVIKYCGHPIGWLTQTKAM